MKHQEFEDMMRKKEVFHSIKMQEGVWPVIRVDGRGFTKLSIDRFTKPFDDEFREYMHQTLEVLAEEFGAIHAYCQSDEISILLSRNSGIFNRSLEKLVSVSAGIASSTFTSQLGSAVTFDSRLIQLDTLADVTDYFKWRVGDSRKNCLQACCYWALRKSGKTGRQAASEIEKRSIPEKKALLIELTGNSMESLPAWQQEGIAFEWVTYNHEGYNPLTSEVVYGTRRQLGPMKAVPKDYADYLAKLIERDEALEK